MSRDILERPAPPADQRIVYGQHRQQFGDLRVPNCRGPYPLAISLHGGFWRPLHNLNHMAHLCEALRSFGVATWNVEYRRMTENETDWRLTTADALAAVRFARTLPTELDWTRIIVLGFSAGGHLALWTAAHDLGFPLRAAVSLAGAVDLRRGYELQLGNGVVREFLGVSPDEAPGTYRAASPFEQIPIATPVRLIHGTADETVPIEISRRYLQVATAANMDCKLLELPAGDHFAVVDPTEPRWSTVQSALLSYLGMELSSIS